MAYESKSAEQINFNNLVKMEEKKLMSKYPIDMQFSGGSSVFLQKRLRKGSKFFDSGDYQMAKQKSLDNIPINVITGKTIPTPETVPVRKCQYNIGIQKDLYKELRPTH